MKKLLLLAVLVLFAVSCDNIEEQNKRNRTREILAQRYSSLVELEFNGERHEYVLLCKSKSASLAHWEGCKFCKDLKGID